MGPDASSSVIMIASGRYSIMLLVWTTQKEMVRLHKERERKRNNATSQETDTRGTLFTYLKTNSHAVSPKRLLDMILVHDILSGIP